MQKNKTEKAKGADAPFTIGEREKARIERWRGQIAKRLAEIADCPAYVPARWLEKIERRPMVDVLTDRLIADRLTGGERMTESEEIILRLNREHDEYNEERGTRARNCHEKEVAVMAVDFAMQSLPILIPNRRQCEFIRRFYEAGDVGLRPAVRRAVTTALDWEREAEAADKPIPKRKIDAWKRRMKKEYGENCKMPDFLA